MSEELNPLKIYVGWDSREDIAYQVCRESILEHASVPVEIIPLKQKTLRKHGHYWRDIDPLGSTEFTFTRFLVPELAEHEGWALFIDCDFVFLDDVKKLFDLADDKYAIMCAKHDYTPSNKHKMDGKGQFPYPRKNWSSMMLWNCGHRSNRSVTAHFVNDPAKDGKYLHRFTWLQDKEIGEVSHEWNWLVNWYKEPQDGSPKALHYTEGGPWFEEYERCEYAVDWYRVHKKYSQQTINNFGEKQRRWQETVSINTLNFPQETKNLFQKIVEYKVDPESNFYSHSFNELKNLLEENMGNKVAAINTSDTGFEKKGHQYDVVLEAFARGSNGIISTWETELPKDSALIIRGVGGGSQKAFKHCWETGRDFYCVDTGYMGNNKKKTYHRVTKNNLQNLGPIIERDAARLKYLGWSFNRFTPGSKILICPPSKKVMDLFDQPDPETWTKNTVEELKKYTDRPIEIRLKPNRTERVTNKTIWQALEDDVHCLITYNSIAATEALLAGKAAIALGPNAAQVLCNKSLSEVESLRYPGRDEMEMFARHLSYCQFTHAELQNGFAWEIVNDLERNNESN